MNDPNIDCPAAVKPEFSQKDSRFYFKVPVANKHPHPIHFYIASTFGCCLQERTNIRRIEAQKEVTLQFWVKLANLLGGGLECVTLYCSYHKAQEQFPHREGAVRQIKLDFNEDTKVDPAVFQILEAEVDYTLSQAEKLKEEGEPVKALNKYEEAYEIMRSAARVTDAMVECRLSLQDYPGVIRDIEAMLLCPSNDCHFLLAKIKTILKWEEADIPHNEELFHYLKTSLDTVKGNMYNLSAKDHQLYLQLEKEFKKYQKTIIKEPNKLLQRLYQNALEGYNQEIGKSFASKESFSAQLRQLLFQTKHEDIATPDQVIDPINYQIMRKPLIVPSGNSVEQKSLLSYFSTNGYRDPISRKQLDPEYVVPNGALQEFISSHPKLKTWEQYEYDVINS